VTHVPQIRTPAHAFLTPLHTQLKELTEIPIDALEYRTPGLQSVVSASISYSITQEAVTATPPNVISVDSQVGLVSEKEALQNFILVGNEFENIGVSAIRVIEIWSVDQSHPSIADLETRCLDRLRASSQISTI
jgi:hypothetical protein